MTNPCRPRARYSSVGTRYSRSSPSRNRPPLHGLNDCWGHRRMRGEIVRALCHIDLLVVLDRGERVVEVVQQQSPLLVLRRSPESFGVVLQSAPLDEQKVGSRPLQATREREPLKPAHLTNDQFGLAEREFELGVTTQISPAKAHARGSPPHRRRGLTRTIGTPPPPGSWLPAQLTRR